MTSNQYSASPTLVCGKCGRKTRYLSGSACATCTRKVRRANKAAARAALA